jgi:hypothetical protein
MANPAPFVSFYNDGQFIRMENADTAVTSYFKKSTLTLQCDGATSFFLKNDSFQQYFLFADVARPAVDDVKLLMGVFQSWIEETSKDSDAGSPLVSDTTSTLLEVKTFFDKDPMKIAELLTGGATTAFDSGKNAVRMDLTDAAASYAVRQTKLYAPILNNKLMYSVLGAILINDTTKANVRSRAGAFDCDDDITIEGSVRSGNGIFFQYEAGMSLVLRSNVEGSQQDHPVAQAAWNIDCLDGTGPSGVTLDPTTEQTYIFEWSALKGNIVRAGILHEGFPIYCHKFVDVRMGCASVPLRWEISRSDKTSTGDAAYMIQTASSVLLQGQKDIPTYSRATASTLDNIKSVKAGTSPHPIMSLRLKAGSNRASLFPRRLRVINLEQGLAKWSLVLNPTLVGAAFADVGSGSFAQISDAESATSGGIVLATGFFTEAATQTVELDEKFMPLCADVSGTADVLSLVVTYLRGVVAVSASLEWVEQE